MAALEQEFDETRKRLSRLRKGTATFKDIPTAPYQHRRAWVEAPENSGKVRIKPVVVAAIDSALNIIRNPKRVEWGASVGVEFLQHDLVIRGDFAELVALEMATSMLRYPKQYLQLGMRKFNIQDRYAVVLRLKNQYIVKRTINPKTGNAEWSARRVQKDSMDSCISSFFV